MKQIATALFGIVAIVTIVAFFFTLRQITRQEARLTDNLRQRSVLLAESLRDTIEPYFINDESDAHLQKTINKFSDRERIFGLAIYDNKGIPLIVSPEFPDTIIASRIVVANAMDSNSIADHFVDFNSQKTYLIAIPLHNETGVIGALMIVQNAQYINVQLAEIWKINLLRFFVQTLLVSFAILLAIKWLVYEPLRQLVTSLKSLRTEESSSDLSPRSFLFRPLARELTRIKRKLIDARRAAHEEARINLGKLDSPWTGERLHEFINQMLKDRTIMVVSMGEPYHHIKTGATISSTIPAGGLVTAIEPIMQACGGTWIAAGGNGDADALVVDTHDRVRVPPSEPKYTLRRVWLPEEDARKNYEGFCIEGMWALFHNAHNRPIFRKEDWEAYKKINGKFAEIILEEVRDLKKPLIFIQDFQFTLLPLMIKRARPDATVGVFWHIPWVSAESFSICPWKKEILSGMLGADLLGFHTPLYCNNFIESVSKELESLIDYENATVTHEDHITYVKPFPISIAFYNNAGEKNDKKDKEEDRAQLLKGLNITSDYIGMGVERLDYTKGILERLKGIEIFLKKYPTYVSKFTFIQMTAPSRTSITRYQQLAQQIDQEIERINELFHTKGWNPIIFLNRYHTHEEIERIYRLVNVCLVTPLHDGMNLVAKEFVAARSDEKGVLILSQFAGAARELKDALIINPYNAEQTAEAIYTALTMSTMEQTKRMKKLRETVRNNNVYRWAAEYLKTLISIE